MFCFPHSTATLQNLLIHSKDGVHNDTIFSYAANVETYSVMFNDTHAVTEPSTISTFASANPEFMLEGFDWEKDRGAIGFLINQMLPLESLVPDIYSEWRLVVRDALGYLGSHLSPDRLRPKLVEQMQLPPDLPLEKRLMILIQQMPSMQKIGQTVARNRNLNAS
ncbi:MAG: hypothetical protein ACKVHP_06345, partial [Verrucomicrobiales bacterium]